MNVKRNSNDIKRLKKIYQLFLIILAALSIFISIPVTAVNTEKKPLTLEDIMKFKSIQAPDISENGDLVVYNKKPDRGNGELIIYKVKSAQTFAIPRGEKPIISKDSHWVAAEIQPDAWELEKASKKKKLKSGMALLDTTSGKIISVDKVKGFVFSDDSQWLAYRLYPVEEKKDKPKDEKQEKKKEEVEKENSEKTETAPLILRHLISGKEIRLEKVGDSALDPGSRFLAYSLYDIDANGLNNGLYIRELKKNPEVEKKLHVSPASKYTNLIWSNKKSRLAFIFHKNHTTDGTGEVDKNSNNKMKENKSYISTLMTWDGLKDKLRTAVSSGSIPQGWLIPSKNKLTWSKDEDRLFFGFKPVEEYQWAMSRPGGENEKETDLYNIDYLLEKRGVDVWHWNDPLINPNQKKDWDKYVKRVYLSVYHFLDNWYVKLADKQIPELQVPENPNYALGFSGSPYQKEITWDGQYKDVYLFNLKNGTRKKILTHLKTENQQPNVFLSPQGQFVVYYQNKHWYLYNIRLLTTRCLTKSLEIPFYDEDHDYPGDEPSYKLAGWTEKDQSVLINDKYDIWQFYTNTNEVRCVTDGEGRKTKITFRITEPQRPRKQDEEPEIPEEKSFKKNQKILLSAFSHEEKYTAFYRCTLGQKGVAKLIQEPKRFSFIKKAEKADLILYTRESFEEFPDLWISDPGLQSSRKISDANPQIEKFLWGKTELIHWQSLDGIPLQGVVIKPENFDNNKHYPVLVYFYRFFSDRLHQFNQIVINHRPCFPYYAGHGYVLFLPDIRYEIGRPGLSAAKCLVPGVQKLISMGIADPKAIALHGHSWSGYQTAFIITQTDIFAAAVAGAPVSNMTSAYSGIRWGSGLARQFQYEKDQSRIGASFFDAPELYIQNSPVFFADRINTPLLIQFGDKDEAVPWYQGIELYLAMRRLNKNCIFLQYNDEPHHLKKYPNKLDYTIKMKEFLDHYLKGEPAPEWISTGAPYRKK